ncbi:hypothetical protein [Campylobacter lari]|uniref:hypothetical protein n=1 Tax=Campylobacter lari TaxID=201 RepID=UPI0037287278
MHDLKVKIKKYLSDKEKDKNFGYFFDKDRKCYIYHTKFGKERKIDINENVDIEWKFGELTKKIYGENSDTFKRLKNAFEEYLKYYKKKDTIHIKFDKNGEFLQTKEEIGDNFEQTLKENSNQNKFDDKFKEWWDKSINSARMQGNATNLLKEEKKLIENLKKINQATSESRNLTKLFEKLKEVEGMKATARELAYFLQFDEDKFPLANDAMINTAKYIFEMLNKDIKEDNFDDKCKEEVYFDFVLEKLGVKRTDNLPKYYILDQFLNLIDKIKKSDLALITKDKLQDDDKKIQKM